MTDKVLITIHEDSVAPRFDLAAEALIVAVGSGGELEGRRTMLLPQPSAEALCDLILAEGVGYVVCGGIEEEYYQYLTWKKVHVFDSIMGPYARVLQSLEQGGLHQNSTRFHIPGGLG
jgi:hypothetical protein